VHHVEAFDDPYLARCQERSICDLAFALAVIRRGTAVCPLIRAAARAPRERRISFDRFSRVTLTSRDPLTRLGASGAQCSCRRCVDARKNTVRVLRAFGRFRGLPLSRGSGSLAGGDAVLAHGALR